MAIELVMPRLGWTMEEGLLVEWHAQDGAAIKPGDPLFTVEGDKTLNEVVSFDAGVLHIPPAAPAPGSIVAVGALLGYILQPGEALPVYVAPAATVAQREYAAPIAQPIMRGTSATISPRARRVAAELGVDWRTLAGSGRTGRIVERDVRAAVTLHP